MKTLTIEIPDGMDARYDQASGKVTFSKIENQNMRDILKSREDILKYHGLTIEKFEQSCVGLEPYEKGNRWEVLMVAAYNQKQLPDWTDDTYKYWPYFTMPNNPSGAGFSYFGYDYRWSGSIVGARLVFVGKEAKENMLDAVKKFLDIYKESRTL